MAYLKNVMKDCRGKNLQNYEPCPWNIDLLSGRVIFTPSRDKLWEMVRAKDGGVTGEVVKTICDNSHNYVQHDEWTKEDEGDEIQVSDGGSTTFLWVSHVEFSILCIVPLMCVSITWSPIHSAHHYIWPCFTSSASRKKHMLLYVKILSSFYLNNIRLAWNMFLKLLLILLTYIWID